MTRKHKPDGLESKVSVFPKGTIKKDSEGRYIPYCDFGYHQGLVRKPEVCEQRECSHYYKLYINQNE